MAISFCGYDGNTPIDMIRNEFKDGEKVQEIVSSYFTSEGARDAMLALILGGCNNSHFIKYRWPNSNGRSTWVQAVTNYIGDNVAAYKPHLTTFDNQSNATLDDLLNYINNPNTTIKNKAALLKVLDQEYKPSLQKGSSTTKIVAWDNCLKHSKQIIFYGPPGTGKTRKAKIEAAKLVRSNKLNNRDALNAAKKIMQDAEDENYGQIQFIQFHPGYSYNDFMETIDITGQGNGDRIFKKIANTAREDAEKKTYVLIIDEINRANVSEVLGELLYGLEYRDKSFTTGVSNSEFSVPDNLYIIGTMNTADKSLQTLDYAVRRRFSFIEVKAVKPKAIDSAEEKNGCYKIEGNEQGDEKFFLRAVFECVRQDVKSSVARGIEAEDIMPGISYFIVDSIEGQYDEEHLDYKMKHELIPLLKEYMKDGMFSKRKKIYENKSLIELIQNNRYFDRIKSIVEEMQDDESSSLGRRLERTKDN